jgi:hypothetical protein
MQGGVHARAAGQQRFRRSPAHSGRERSHARRGGNTTDDPQYGFRGARQTDFRRWPNVRVVKRGRPRWCAWSQLSVYPRIYTPGAHVRAAGRNHVDLEKSCEGFALSWPWSMPVSRTGDGRTRGFKYHSSDSCRASRSFPRRASRPLPPCPCDIVDPFSVASRLHESLLAKIAKKELRRRRTGCRETCDVRLHPFRGVDAAARPRTRSNALASQMVARIS